MALLLAIMRIAAGVLCACVFGGIHRGRGEGTISSMAAAADAWLAFVVKAPCGGKEKTDRKIGVS